MLSHLISPYVISSYLISSAYFMLPRVILSNAEGKRQTKLNFIPIRTMNGPLILEEINGGEQPLRRTRKEKISSKDAFLFIFLFFPCSQVFNVFMTLFVIQPE